MPSTPLRQTVSFFGTVGAGQNKTLVSQHIQVPFKTKNIRASFAPGVDRLMTLKYFISGDPSAPTTAQPDGTNILAQIGQVPYITGDDEFKNLEHETMSAVGSGYIKVYAENADVFDHTIDTQVTIEYEPVNDNA